MSLYQRFVGSVLHPLDRWRTGDAAELRYLREFERTQFLPPEEIRALVLERLQRLLGHAYEQCPFYRNRLDRSGFVPHDLRSLDDLSAVPILEKGDIQRHRDEMVATDWPRADLIENQTGGSTGTPVSFYLSNQRRRSRAAATLRHNRWAGWNVGDKIAVIWGAPRDVPQGTWKARLRNALITRSIWLDAAHVTEFKLKQFQAAMRRFRPKHVLAYATPLVLFARYLKERELPVHRPESIVVSAEVLEPSDRALVEQVFGCPVFNRYGCREVSVIASECEQHDGLHVMAEGLYVEVVEGDRPAEPGELGEVLVTDLLNFAMPLVRYRIGDMAVYDPTPCPCGRGLPRLKSVEGRVTDFVVGSDGRLVSGVFLNTYVVARRPALGQVQLRQDVPGQVLYKIAADGRRDISPSDLKFLQTETKRYVGSDTKVEYELVERLRPEPSGKYLFCRSSVACDFLGGSSSRQPALDGAGRP
jgi:phenylacetate-CoA ligase